MHITVIPVTPLQQNCMLVTCPQTQGVAVVDPGGDVPLILEALQRSGAHAEAIYLTHGHIDHAGGAADLATALNAPVIGPHADDKFLLDNLPAAGRNYGMDNAKAVTPHRWLVEGDSLALGNLVFEVRHIPGHCPGHVVFVNHAHKSVLCGDTVFQGSVGRTDFPRSNTADLMKGLRDKILTLDDDYTLYPGHGPATTVGDERRNNPFLRSIDEKSLGHKILG